MKALLPVLLMFPLWGLAESGSDLLASGKAALNEGLPRVAVHKLQLALEHNLTDADRRVATLELGKALLKANRNAEAAEILGEALLQGEPEALLWRAEACARQDQTEQALSYLDALLNRSTEGELHDRALLSQARLLRSLAKHQEALDRLGAIPAQSAWQNQAIIERTEILLELGHPQQALVALESLQNPTGQNFIQKSYLEALALMQAGQYERAAAIFSSLEMTDPRMAAWARIGAAECLMRSGNVAEAESALERFIQDNPRNPLLVSLFKKLDEVYAFQRSGSTSELRRWRDNQEVPGRGELARYFLSRVEGYSGDQEKAIQQLEEFLAKNPGHELEREARLDLARNLMQRSEFSSIPTILQPLSQDADALFITGLARFQLQNYEEAAADFFQAANLGTENLGETALFNAGICELAAGAALSQSLGYFALQAKYPDSIRRDKLRLVAALLEASRDPDVAIANLKKLVDGSRNGLGAEAAVALAEIYYARRDRAAARSALQRVANADPTTDQQAEVLRIFLTDQGDEVSAGEAARLAENFLQQYPDSPNEAEIRLKLGELYFRRGDMNRARAQFESAARLNAGPALREKALFMAGQASARLLDPASVDAALVLYEEVAASGGSMALRARLEQALLQNGMGKANEALILFDRILESNPDSELRNTVLVEKGDTLYSMGRNDPEKYREAIQAWKAVLDDTEISLRWRNQALTKIGIAYEKLGETDAALASFYDAIVPTKNGEPEYFWFYKAGFEGGRMLEEQKEWTEAIRLYERLAAIDGPRAEEARNRVSKLRLENFIWE